MTTTIYGPLIPFTPDRRLVTRLPLATIARTPLGPVRRLPAPAIEARLAAMGVGADWLAQALRDRLEPVA